MIRAITDLHLRHIAGAHALVSNAAPFVDRTYDVCVIGSGPGGSVAAATLAAAGLEVVLIERGPFRPPHDFTFQVLDMATRLGHLEFTQGHRAALLQGSVLGGSSVIFGAVAMRPPAAILHEWREQSGVEWLDGDQLEPHYAHVGRELSVTRQNPAVENRANAIVREMAHALGRPDGLQIVERYTRGCAGMGLCNLGCGLNLKGTMLNSFVPQGLDTGRLTILTECEVESLAGERRGGLYRATGARIVCRDFESGHVVARPTIKARAFIIAAGAFFSAAVLCRSRDLPHRDRIGAHVYLQPHAQVFALFDDPVTARGTIQDDRYLPYSGVPAIYNFTGFLADRGFFWLPSILFPANFAAFISHLPLDVHTALMRRFHYTTSVTLTLRDNPFKSRLVIDEGRARLDFRESAQDIRTARDGFAHAARGFLRVGARRVFLPLLQPPSIERESDVDALARSRFGYDEVLLYSDHTSGGVPIGADRRRGIADEAGRIFDTTNVHVADASLFPSACGVNPSWTIMALSHRVSIALARELAR